MLASIVLYISGRRAQKQVLSNDFRNSGSVKTKRVVGVVADIHRVRALSLSIAFKLVTRMHDAVMNRSRFV